MKLVATYLRTIREQRGLSQDALAELSGLHPRTIQEFEQGQSKTSAVNVARIVKALHASPEDVQALILQEDDDPDEAIARAAALLAEQALGHARHEQLTALQAMLDEELREEPSILAEMVELGRFRIWQRRGHGDANGPHKR